MKKYILLFITITIASNIYPDNTTIDKIIFTGYNLKNSSYHFDKDENDNNYNLIYSPFLPAGAIYHITDRESNKNAIVQIGLADVDQSPYALYLPDHLYQFFTSSNSKKKDLALNIKFIGWNKADEQSLQIDILNLMILPEKSLEQIQKDGPDNYYIQIGAFSFYQNSYPQIIKSFPYLKIIPHFYLLQSDKTNKNELYKILAGPYSLQTAREVVRGIDESIKTKMFIHSSETIIKEFSN